MTTVFKPQAIEQIALRANVVRFGLGLGLSALSGVLLLLAFPPYGIWPLAWFALVPALVAQFRLLPTRWSSLGCAIYTGLWLGPFLARLFGSGFGPVFQYLGVLIAVITFFTAKERIFHERTSYRWFIAYGVINWVGFEMIRATFIPIVATSAFIGYTQATQPWIIQPVSIFSVYGLNILIILVNYTLAQSLMTVLDRHGLATGPIRIDPGATRRWLIGTGSVLAGWVLLSLIILLTLPEMPSVRVASLRPNFPIPAHQDTVNTDLVRFDTFAEQALEAADKGAQIIYSPEMMVNFDPQRSYTQEFRDLAARTNAYLFLSYTVSEEGQDWRNEAVMLSPTGVFSEVYGKYHTWMIGEQPTPSAGKFPVFSTPLGKLAIQICHDNNYTDVARKLAGNGAQIIGAPFREFAGFGEQAWTNALFRAVENRAAVVVIGVSSVSAIINPNGSLVALDTDINGSRMTMVGDVTLGSGGAPYTLLGDVLGWTMLAAYIFFMIYPSIVNRRANLKAAVKMPAE